MDLTGGQGGFLWVWVERESDLNERIREHNDSYMCWVEGVGFPPNTCEVYSLQIVYRAADWISLPVCWCRGDVWVISNLMGCLVPFGVRNAAHSSAFFHTLQVYGQDSNRCAIVSLVVMHHGQFSPSGAYCLTHIPTGSRWWTIFHQRSDIFFIYCLKE